MVTTKICSVVFSCNRSTRIRDSLVRLKGLAASVLINFLVAIACSEVGKACKSITDKSNSLGGAITWIASPSRIVKLVRRAAWRRIIS